MMIHNSVYRRCGTTLPDVPSRCWSHNGEGFGL
jgi:hypothetical protein